MNGEGARPGAPDALDLRRPGYPAALTGMSSPRAKRLRTRRLIDACNTIRDRGRYRDWSFGEILIRADDPLPFFRYVARNEQDEQAEAARVLLRELERHQRVLTLAASLARPLGRAA